MTLLELRVAPWLCTRARHRQSTCTLCVGICPTSAISLNGAPPQIARERCTGCGACAAVCPTGALETAPVNAVVPDAGAAPGVTIGCARWSHDPRNQPVVTVSCIGRVDEATLLRVAAAGARPISVLTGACRACPSSAASGAAEQVVAQANTLLQATGCAVTVEVDRSVLSPPAPVAAPELGIARRRLFAALTGRQEQTGAADTPGRADVLSANHDAGPVDRLPARAPARRQRLLETLGQMPSPVYGSPGAVAGLSAQFAITDDCTGCQMCAYFCPTGALKTIERDGRVGLAFKMALCTNCRLCQDVCHWKAVLLSSQFDLGKLASGAVDLLWPQQIGTAGSELAKHVQARSTKMLVRTRK